MIDGRRNEHKRLARQQARATSSSVTKATGVLVVGENPGSKVDKAHKYGTEIMSDEELMALLRHHGAV